MSISDQELKNIIDQIFSTFDKDNSQSLDKSEVTNFFNAVLKGMGENKEISQA
jgi:hypothetical protein